MARSSWKFKYFSKYIWKKIYYLKSKKKLKKVYKLHLLYERSSTVPLCLRKFPFLIHKGKGFRKFSVNFYNIGFKFGEFSFTRKPYHFPIKKSKKIRK